MSHRILLLTVPRPVRLLTAILVLWSAGCWRAEVPAVAPPPDPFVRAPYVQAVTDSSAEILWMTARPVPDSLDYWIDAGVSGPDADASAPAADPVPAPGDTVRVTSSEARLRHRVSLAPLPPSTTIGYRVHGSVHRFRTAPGLARTAPGSVPGDDLGDGLRDDLRSDALGPRSSTMTALVFGDSGLGSEGQMELARRMDELPVDLILHTGDVAYPDGTDFDLTHRHFAVYRELLARAPFYPAIGNHDAHTEGGRPFERAFVLPEMPEAEGGFFGSFDWGPIHFVVLDSTGDADDREESNLRQRGGQFRWLERDLEEAADDPRSAWIVAVLHHPPYSSGTGLVGHGSDEELRGVLTPLFDRYGVDLVLTGHDHHYERSLPVRGGVVDSDTPGTVYVVTGGGGGTLKWRAVGREWHAAVTAFEHHYVTLELEESRLKLRAIGHEGDVIDEYQVRPVPPGE